MCVTLKSRRAGGLKIKLANSSIVLKVESLKLHILHFRLLAHGVTQSDSYTQSEQVRVGCLDTLTQHVAAGRITVVL